MKIKKQNKVLMILVTITFVFLPKANLYAEFHINPLNILSNLEWSQTNNPYIIDENVTIPDRYLLKINSGVRVIPASTTDNISIKIKGDVQIDGSMDSGVEIDNIDKIILSNNSSNINYTIFNNSEIIIENSTTSIKNSIFENAVNAITSNASRVDIQNSVIKNNINGIKSKYSGSIFQVNNDDLAIGGIGNALVTEGEVNENSVRDYSQDIIKIHNSDIYNNINFGLNNSSINQIIATNNWWGNISGPNDIDTNKNENLGDIVLGNVTYNPWSDKPNNLNKCCSNILFIPGIQASRLYRVEHGLNGSSTNMLWEPNRNNDVDLLSMNTKGQSINKGIFTKDIIDKAYGVKDIYSNLINYLNDAVKTNKINEWKSLPYDWRYDVMSLVNSNEMSEIYKLASTSRTGKITIISHSNGGLYTKALINKINNNNTSNIIDKIIFVAVPEFGTPQAILGMLHGYGQSILGGLFLSQDKARKFSQNIPGAYGLLPTKTMINNSNNIKIIDSYSTIGTSSVLYDYNNIKDFLLNNLFSKRNSDDINTPLLLNKYLLNESEKVHDTLDNWHLSSTTKISTILGWGNMTTTGIEYNKEAHCNTGNCSIEFNPILSLDGDGTVLNISNSNKSDNTFYLNLKKIKKEKNISINHSNIFSSNELIAKIDNLIKDNSVNMANVNDPYITNHKPVDETKYLSIRIHSPINIDVYDEFGNHTGVNTKNNNDKYEANIPDTYYEEYGRVKMLIIPYDLPRYKINLSGNDTGPFSIDASINQNGNIISSTKFSDMPVTSNSKIQIDFATSTKDFASSSVMKIDIDGDNIYETTNHSDYYLKTNKNNSINDISTYISSLKKILIYNRFNDYKKVSALLSRINRLEIKLEKNGYKTDMFFTATNLHNVNTELKIDAQNKILNGVSDMIRTIENQYK